MLRCVQTVRRNSEKEREAAIRKKRGSKDLGKQGEKDEAAGSRGKAKLNSGEQSHTVVIRFL